MSKSKAYPPANTGASVATVIANQELEMAFREAENNGTSHVECEIDVIIKYPNETERIIKGD